jgi:hypothetical protein
MEYKIQYMCNTIKYGWYHGFCRVYVQCMARPIWVHIPLVHEKETCDASITALSKPES